MPPIVFLNGKGYPPGFSINLDLKKTLKINESLLKYCTDIRYIQSLLGYNYSRTTEIYTHVS